MINKKIALLFFNLHNWFRSFRLAQAPRAQAAKAGAALVLFAAAGLVMVSGRIPQLPALHSPIARAASTDGTAQVAGETVDVRNLIPPYNPQLDIVKAPASSFGTGTIWHVGPNEQYKTFSSIASQLHDGDIVEIDAGSYGCTEQSIKWSASYITVVGVGSGRAVFDMTNCGIAGDKGIFNPLGDGTIIDNIAFIGAKGASANDAGIRYDGKGYVYLTNSYFQNNEDGVLFTPNDGAATNVVFDHDEFDHNGGGTGQTHNIYISTGGNSKTGGTNSFVIRFSYSHDANVGHEVKTRANINYILYNRLADEADGNASYEIDVPQGGLTYIIGNILQKGPKAQNSNEIEYAGESEINPIQKIYVANNTIINEDNYSVNARAALYITDHGLTEAKMVNNLIVGLASPAHLTVGPGASKVVSTNNIFTNSPGFYDEANRNYYLTASSPAVDAGVDPGTGDGLSLTPIDEFQFPTSFVPRPTHGALDVGAYEYTPDQVIPSLPTISLNVLSPVDYNTPTTVTWNAQNAQYCNASGDWSGAQAPSGSYTTSALTATKTYNISCTGAGGTASKTVTATVKESPQAAALGAYTWKDIPNSSLSTVCVDATKNADGTYTYKDDFGWWGEPGRCGGGYTTGVYVPDTDTFYIFGVSIDARAENSQFNTVYGFNLDTLKPEVITTPDHISATKEYAPTNDPKADFVISDCSTALHLKDGTVIRAPSGTQGEAAWDPLIKKIVIGQSLGVLYPSCPGTTLNQFATDLWSFDPLAASNPPVASTAVWKQLAPANDAFGSVSNPLWLFDPFSGIAYTAGNRAIASRAGRFIDFNTNTPTTKIANSDWPYGQPGNNNSVAIDTTNHWAMDVGSVGAIAMWNLNGLSMDKYSASNPFTSDLTWKIVGDTDFLGIRHAVGITYNPTIKAFVAWGGGNTVFFLYPNYQTKTINIVAKIDATGTAPAGAGGYGSFTYIPSKNEYLVFSDGAKDFYLFAPGPGGATTTPPSQSSKPSAILSASSISINPGGSATLTWNSTNATSCTGTGFTASGISGSVAVSPSHTTTYSVSCSGKGGTASALTTVTVISPISGNSIKTTGDFSQTTTCGDALAVGQSCTISVTFTPTGVGTRTGTLSFSDPITDTTDTVSLSGVGRATTSNATSSPATPPATQTPTATLTASPSSINSSGSATLTWNSTNATSCTGTGFSASGTSGSVSVSPTQTTTYAINCGGATANANVMVGAAPTPPPPPSGSTVISQIHNAPGWLPHHSYAYATGPYTRVNAGAGWNPSSQTWNPGQSLAAYQLTSSGSCTSGTAQPSGTGSSIKDGSCTWKYLSPTDYVSLTGWTFDNQQWKSGTTYSYHNIVTSDSPLRAYILIDKNGCISTVAPTGTGSTFSADGDGDIVTTSDGCDWVHTADILYSSRKSYIPTQSYNSGYSSGAATINMQANYQADLWNDREYVAGQIGEKSPIEIRNHNSYYGEGQTNVCSSSHCPHVIVTTAPGESFADTMTPSDPLTGVDPSKGVTIVDNGTYRWPVEPDGLYVENFTDVIGLQIVSAHGSAVGSLLASYDNDVTIRDSILDGGHTDQWTEPTTVSVDTGSAVVNSLVISHANAGITLKYPGYVLHDTIVSPDGTGQVGIETGNKWVFNDTTVADTAIFGFAHAGGHNETGTSFNALSSNNVTDAPTGDSGSTTWESSSGATVDTIPGTTYGVSASAAFVKPGSDWRAKSGGPLVGTGSAFGTFGLYCTTSQPTCAGLVDYNFDTPDLIGTARPQGGSYDIGAWQTPQGGVSLAVSHNLAAADMSGVSFFSTIGSDISNFFSSIWRHIADFFASLFGGHEHEEAAVALSISPNSLDFGSVVVGQSETKTVTLTVTSSGTETTSSGGTSGGGSSSNSSSGSSSGSNSSGSNGNANTNTAGNSGGTQSGAPAATAPVPQITRYLYRGISGSDVTALQNYLISLGYMPSDDNTGYFGSVTTGAVQKLQCKLGVVCSGDPDSTGWGVVGPKTIRALTGASVAPTPIPAPANNPTIFPGEEGSIVTTLQNILISKGYLPQGDNTGYYGDLTENAVAKFQCNASIICYGDPVTTGYGQAGPHTRAALGL